MSKQFSRRVVYSLMLYSGLFLFSTYLTFFIGQPYLSLDFTLGEIFYMILFFVADFLWWYFSDILIRDRTYSCGTWFLANLVASLVLAPTVEELICRFFIMKVALIDGGLNVFLAAIISNIVFVALHFTEIKVETTVRSKIRTTINLSVSGFLITGMYVISGFNILAAVILHTAVNVIPFILEWVTLPKCFKKL